MFRVQGRQRLQVTATVHGASRKSSDSMRVDDKQRPESQGPGPGLDCQGPGQGQGLTPLVDDRVGEMSPCQFFIPRAFYVLHPQGVD